MVAGLARRTIAYRCQLLYQQSSRLYPSTGVIYDMVHILQMPTTNLSSKHLQNSFL